LKAALGEEPRDGATAGDALQRDHPVRALAHAAIMLGGERGNRPDVVVHAVLPRRAD
jgi:hypothetical protein